VKDFVKIRALRKRRAGYDVYTDLGVIVAADESVLGGSLNIRMIEFLLNCPIEGGTYACPILYFEYLELIRTVTKPSKTPS
jgi:hypothetical protein